MYLVIVLSAVAGAGIFFAGWYVGHVLDREKAQIAPKRKVRKSRPPKCWVVVPGGPDEEQKKMRKKQPVSEDAMSAFDESKIKGTDVRV